jgi:cytochrome c
MTGRRSALAIGLATLAAAMSGGGAGRAQDAAQGRALYDACRDCHAITAPDGTTVEPGGDRGPNLHGVIGRRVGSADFDFSPALRAFGETGYHWDETSLAEFSADPTGWLRAISGDGGARSSMPAVPVEGMADIAAYLAAAAPRAD